jgi:Predicted UDP-glucose 6-dehydrogenase
MKILEAVEEVNEFQKKILFEKLMKYYDNDIKGKTIAVWGTRI